MGHDGMGWDGMGYLIFFLQDIRSYVKFKGKTMRSKAWMGWIRRLLYNQHKFVLCKRREGKGRV